MEIEKKFLVSDIPDLSQAVKVFEIEQGYLCSEPTVRIRRKNDDYILTYKNRIAVDDEALNVSDEREMPLTKDSFFHLKQKWHLHKKNEILHPISELYDRTGYLS